MVDRRALLQVARVLELVHGLQVRAARAQVARAEQVRGRRLLVVLLLLLLLLRVLLAARLRAVGGRLVAGAGSGRRRGGSGGAAELVGVRQAVERVRLERGAQADGRHGLALGAGRRAGAGAAD